MAILVLITTQRIVTGTFKYDYDTRNKMRVLNIESQRRIAVASEQRPRAFWL